MKNHMQSVFGLAVVVQAGLLAATASAQVTWTSSVAPAPTYSSTLDFDEAGGPTGLPIAPGALTSRGVSIATGNEGCNVASGNVLLGTTFLPANNQAISSSYLDFTFSQDMNAFSVQFWESAPNASPFGSGGARIDLFNHGAYVDSLFITNPFWQSNLGQAGTLPTWFNVVGAPGQVWDQVVFNGFGNPFGSDVAAVDNMSWNSVPTPGAVALLGLGVLGAGRRRRSI